MKTPAYLYFLLFSLFGNTIIANAQQTIGLFQNSDTAYQGYTLFSPQDSETTFLINNCGEKVHSWTSEYLPGLSSYLLEDGLLLRTGRVTGMGGGFGVVEMLDWDSNVIWSHSVSGTHGRQHHDIELLPNGNILLIVWDERTQAEVVQAGSSTNNESIHSEQIVEIQPDIQNGGATVVWEWKAWDHLIQDADPQKDYFGVIADSPELIDINFLNHNNPDWLHFNGVDYNEQFDQIIISVHNFSEFWIIDHSTNTDEAAGSSGGTYGKGGDLLYRWGNPIAYDQGTQADQKLFLQHHTHWIPDGLADEGKILLFNNQVGSAPNYSTVNIVDLPVDADGNYAYSGGSYAPADFHWTYQADTPSDFYSHIISGAERLENGNTLICEGIGGRFFEIDPEGATVWEYINPVNDLGPMEQFTTPESNNVFRCTRYGFDYPGLAGQTLSPQGYIEIGSTFTCELAASGCDDPLADNFGAENESCVYSGSQLLNLNEGWSLFSTYLLPNNLALDNIFETVIDEVVIIKNNVGAAYLPSLDFNGIGDLIMGQGYQIKMNTSEILSVQGQSIIPGDYPINLAQGWNLIGCLNEEPEDLTLVLADVIEEVIIVKDEIGAAYLPDWDFNGIGDLHPSKGYQVKMNSAQTLVYGSQLVPCDPVSIFANQTTNAYCYEINDQVRTCYTNNIPSHSYGPFGGNNTISSQEFEYNMCLYPSLASSSTPLSFQTNTQGCAGGLIFGVSMEGINYSPYARLFWVNPDTQEENTDYEVEASFILNMDSNGGHVNVMQRYHYHEIPTEYFGNNSEINPESHSPVLGYAADGFPIYYKYVFSNPLDAGSSIVDLSSAYALKSGERPGDGITAPDGAYDGTYVQDYEYVEGLSELDECGGRFAVTPEYPNGTYYYVLTDNWPNIPRCLKGEYVDNSFKIGPNCPDSDAAQSCSPQKFSGVQAAISRLQEQSFIELNMSRAEQKDLKKLRVLTPGGEVLFESEEYESKIAIDQVNYEYVLLQISWAENELINKIYIK